MRVCGRTISNMDMESRLGQTSQDMKESMLLDANMVLEAISGTMDPCTLETGERIRSQVLVFTHGSMAEDIRESGLTIIWREWEFTFGMMAECTKVNTKMTRNMDLEYTLGLIKDAMKATGSRESSMALEHTLCLKTIKSSLDFGKMVRESSGSMRLRFKQSIIVR